MERRGRAVLAEEGQACRIVTKTAQVTPLHIEAQRLRSLCKLGRRALDLRCEGRTWISAIM